MKRPKVIVYVTTSLDGRIALAPNQTMNNQNINLDSYPRFNNLFGDWQPFENKVKALHHPNVWMEGSNMIMYEGQKIEPLPKFNEDSKLLYNDYLPKEIVNRPGRILWLAIVDGKGRIRDGYKGDENPENHIILLTSNAAPPEYLAFLRQNKIPYLIAGEKRVDLKVILQKMSQKLDVKCVLTSSAGKLSGALIREDLIDEIIILLNPVVIGGFQTPIIFASPEVHPPEVLPSKLELISSEVNKDDSIWLRYKVIHNMKKE